MRRGQSAPARRHGASIRGADAGFPRTDPTSDRRTAASGGASVSRPGRGRIRLGGRRARGLRRWHRRGGGRVERGGEYTAKPEVAAAGEKKTRWPRGVDGTWSRKTGGWVG